MRLSFKLLLVFFLIIALVGYFAITIVVREIKPGIRNATENTLIDTANILAQMATLDIAQTGSVQQNFTEAFNNLNQEPIGANVNGHVKNRVGYRVYITDSKGIVIFDSANEAVGQDYSRWNDVYRTLRGQYGARSTKTDPDDPTSSVMYVAAPIKIDNKIAGVLTVAKPNKEMASVVLAGEARVKTTGLTLVGVALLIAVFFVWWLNHDVSKLGKYALRVSEGQKISLPKMSSPEFNALAQALEQMRVRLEGKAYVEKYVHTLTHELKSPLAAIKGATEILQDNPPDHIRQRFLSNIVQQQERMHLLIERMLKQVQIEHIDQIDFHPVNLIDLIQKVISEKQAQFVQAGVRLLWQNKIDTAMIPADELMLEQALSNLLENALDFSLPDGQVTVRLMATGDFYLVEIEDNGCGIPEYALDRIFERFYSLPRPEKAKSTGLGLSFVQEVALLHHGNIQLENVSPHGVCARLFLRKTIENDEMR